MPSHEYNSEHSNPPSDKEALERFYRTADAISATSETMEYNKRLLDDLMGRIVPRLDVFKYVPRKEDSTNEALYEHLFVPDNHQLEGIFMYEQHNDGEDVNILEWRVIISEEMKHIFWECSLEGSSNGIEITIAQYELEREQVTSALVGRFLTFEPTCVNDPRVVHSAQKHARVIGSQSGAEFSTKQKKYMAGYEDISIEEMEQRFRQPQ